MRLKRAWLDGRGITQLTRSFVSEDILSYVESQTRVKLL